MRKSVEFHSTHVSSTRTPFDSSKRRTRNYSKVLNFLGFQFGWFSSVIGAAQGYEWIGPIVVTILAAYYIFSQTDRFNAIQLVLLTGLIGSLLDSLLVSFGIVNYLGNWAASVTCPLWVTGLWINFSLTLRSSLNWLSGRYFYGAVLGAVGGPLAYISGESLGAVQMSSEPFGLAIVAFAWSLALPVVLWLDKCLESNESTTMP